MINLRLFLDTSGLAWALVECDRCGDVYKYPLEEARTAPVRCKHCDASLDLREAVLAKLLENPKAFERGVSNGERTLPL